MADSTLTGGGSDTSEIVTAEPEGLASGWRWTARISLWLRDLVVADEPAAVRAGLSEVEADELRDPDMDRCFAAFMTSPLY